MNLLLDTHALLWWLADEPLSERARAEIADPGNAVAVSAASIWEVALKRALGKVTAPDGLALAVEETGFDLLAITAQHAEAAGELPPHHRDPFDRMLIAQAGIEGLVVVTRDAAFEPYDVSMLAC